MREIRSLELWYINSTYHLRAYSVTTAGVGYCADNAIHMVRDADIENLPGKIMTTLAECQHGIPHPDFKIKEKNEMLKAVGLKTEKALMQNGKTISIYFKYDHLELSPYYFDGKHLTSTLEMGMRCSLNPADIINTVQEALKKCGKLIK